QQIQAGAKFKLFGKTIPGTPPPPPIPVVTDRDGDGVADADDKCPDVAGSASLMGCPDRDGDGIADADDKCPDAAGTAKYQGCPIPDTDGDGINDEMDKCPTVAGTAKYEGCPIPDTDGDGVNDEMDKCPTRAGDAANQGCPVIAKEVIEKVNYAAKNVFFATGSYKLLAKSNQSLDAVAALLKADESLMIDIDGHTDAQGSDESNQVLSDNRAGAVKNYLVSKGIAETRLKSAGYGESKPVADNTTAAGRAKNRRTEMVVRNY
ncbi:MAG: OmpA family protein, partial [Pedobacter sp.]